MKKISTGDFVILAVLFLLAALTALLFFLPRSVAGKGGELAVYQNDRRTVYSLAEDREFTLSSAGYTLHIAIKDGSASVTKADCPDKFCMHSGSLSHRGDAAVCLPAGILLRIEGGGDFGETDGETDAVAG